MQRNSAICYAIPGTDERVLLAGMWTAPEIMAEMTEGEPSANTDHAPVAGNCQQSSSASSRY
eukprot:1322913-Rhodomonas_salina.1